MEKKNNKKLFAIIGGSVLAFILTIALSVSITLAYFGQSDNGTATLKMGNAITVGEPAVAEDVELDDMLPAEAREVTIEGTVKSDGEGTPTDALIRFSASAVVGEGFDSVETPVEFEVVSASVDGTAYTTTKEGNYYYLMDKTVTTNCAVITGSTTGNEIELVVRVTASADLTNTSANKTITVSFEIGAAQANINGDKAHTPAEAAAFFTAAA